MSIVQGIFFILSGPFGKSRSTTFGCSRTATTTNPSFTLGVLTRSPSLGTRSLSFAMTFGNHSYRGYAMIGASTEVVGLISLGKMGTSLPYLVGPASRLTRLITDASDEDVLNPYRSQGIEVTST